MSNETPPFRDHPAVRAVIGFGRVPDAVDAAIERHRAAREELQRASSGVDAASNADGVAWADLLATRPGDVPGAVRLLRYVSGSPASEVVEDPQDLLRQLLAAVEAGETGERQGEGAPAAGEASAAIEPAEEPVDWHNPPPGFMASPAIEPFGFTLISQGIAIELGRLRGIALAEFERRSMAGMAPEGEERLRRDLHLDTLSKAARGEGGFAVWPTPGAEAATVRDWQAEAAMHPGFVPYPAHAPRILMDLEGAIRGETGRLLELAEAEIARRRAAYDGFHDPSVWPQVERDLRREMRMDALAVAAGSRPADDGAADPRLCALVTAWEAAERAGNAPGRSDEEHAPLIDHASGLLRDVYAFPARTMADICAKLPAYRDEAANTGDAPDTPDSEVTLEACALRGLVADLERLAAERTTGPEHPDAELLRLIASVEAAQVRCDAAHTTWAEAEKAAAATRPGQPDELRRANDFQHFWGVAANPHSPEFYTADEVAKFRQYEPVGHANVKAEAAARARAAEIVAAFWGWQAQIRAHDEACGVAALDRAHDETCDDYQKVLSAVVSARPATLAGVLAKARISLSEDTIEFDRILRDDLLAMSGSLA